MRKIEEKQIGEFKVTTQRLPTLLGSELRFKLGKLLSGKAGEVDGASVLILLSSLTVEDQRKLLAETFVCTTVIRTDENGELLSFDLGTNALKMIDRAFDGDIDALWEAVSFVWDFNFKPRPTKGVAVAPIDPAP